MKRPPDDHRPAGHGLPSGFLTPAIRRDVADVNRRFLDLTLEPALASDPRFALPDEIRPALRAGGDELLTRVAACPFTLFEVSLTHGRLGGLDRAPGVEDTRVPLLDFGTASRARDFAQVAVFLAWRLADDEPLAFRIVLGLSAGDELLLNQARPSDLPRLACAPPMIRPRWTNHPRYWRLLVRAAAGGGEATLQRVHGAGICSVVAELWGRGGRSPDGSGRGRRP